jgi:arylsulfatase A-like enzyme
VLARARLALSLLPLVAAACGGRGEPVVFLLDLQRPAGRPQAVAVIANEQRPILVPGDEAPHAPARPRLRLGPLAVPRGARLRVGLGFDPDHCARHPPTDFRLAAKGAGGRWTLLHRRLEPRTACGHWTDAEVSLEPLAGDTVRFAFTASAVGSGPDRERTIHPLWSDPVMVSPAPRSRRPNVILISLDTLGARHLGAYGYPHPTSPHLDRLAADATLFAHARSHYPSTAGSHMALFTALLPAAHGVRHLGDRLPDDVPTLPELLRAGGYTTAAVAENFILNLGMGFGRGFHTYVENRVPKGGTVAGGQARETFRRGLRWLGTRPPEPFFLFLHTYEVHEPYDPPPGHLRLVRSGTDGEPAADAAWRYDAEIRFLDRLLAHFLRALARRGLLERTLLVITSDHGDAFWEHGHQGHGPLLYDEVMHVPLLLSGAGMPRGRRVSAAVGLVDVMPTVLELAGLPGPSGLHGRSLVPLLRGETVPSRPLVAEVRGLVIRPMAPTNTRAVWLGDHKVIRDLAAGRWEVYDLPSDPGEQFDRVSSDGAVVAEAARVLAWYETLERGPDRSPATPPVLDPDTREQLRALGYVD